MGKKIKFNIPLRIKKIIKRDVDNFKVNKNFLCNAVFKKLNSRYESYELADYSSSEQFRLHKDNGYIYQDMKFKSEFLKNESKFFRNLLVKYSKFPTYKRERIVLYELVDSLNQAIKTERNIKVNYKTETRKLAPFFIINNKEEEHNYLVCYCYKHKKLLNYKISGLKSIFVTSDKINSKIRKKYKYEVEKLKKDFTPFFGDRTKVKVAFTDEGIKKMNRVDHNRPMILKQKGKKYIFNCSEEQAIIYFAQFFSTVEILSPKSLRERIKNLSKEVYQMYN